MIPLDLKHLLKRTKELNILYVEDELDIREETEDILNGIFKKVVVASNGIEGISKFSKDIDLILTDINMPKMDGIKMIKKIRKTNLDIPILILSAHSNTNYFLKTITLGIDGYILKPIESIQLFLIISKVVEKITLKKENQEYKYNLELKVIEEIEKREYQEKILIQQSKLAAMGEMIDAVAHQWKQPLNIMKMNVDMLQYDFEDNLINKEYIEEFNKKFFIQMDHTVNTLDEFRSFFRPNQDITEFYISTIVESTLLLVKDEFMKKKICFSKTIQEDISLYGNQNEFKHLILNIINNAKDEFIEKDIKNRNININSYQNEDKIVLEICDNAGGISLDIIDDIFKPNVTTKAEGKGTGIGLYISQQIANKLNGTLYVKNITNGGKFVFEKLLR